MERSPYTSARWVVRPGQEEAFVAAWEALGQVFLRLPSPPGWGILMRNDADPREFVSFGPWPDRESIVAMRKDPTAAAALVRLREMCDVATPASYHVVATAGHLPDELTL